jgi:hypothetical protein
MFTKKERKRRTEQNLSRRSFERQQEYGSLKQEANMESYDISVKPYTSPKSMTP